MSAAASPHGVALQIDQAIADLDQVQLQMARAETARLVADDGITYGFSSPGAPSDDSAEDEERAPAAWRVDPLPVVIDGTEWAGLERGLTQRARVLNALLADCYGERRLLRDGLLPPEVIFGHPGFLPVADGLRPPAQAHLVLSATDLVRDSHGTWQVMADRSGTPVGAGYALATRRIISVVMARMHRVAPVARLRNFFHVMTQALQDAAPNASEVPRGVLLSPGAEADTAFEHGFLATLLGFPLVEAEDLTVREGRVYVSAQDRFSPVDVILRHTRSELCDPLDLRPDSELGVAGLVEATRLNNVSVLNPLGSGVIENVALQAYLPRLCREVTGEDLLLPSPATYWCGDPRQRSHVLAAMDQWVFTSAMDRGSRAVPGAGLSQGERAELAARIEQRPWAWSAQENVSISSAPVATDQGREPRRFVLRTFGVSQADGWTVMPGGLGRVAADRDNWSVSHTGGAIAKDVWVISDERADLVAPEVRPGRDAGRRTVLAPRMAHNLYLIGHYNERAEAAARVLRVTGDLVEDHVMRPGTTGWQVMTCMLDAASAITGVPRRRASGEELSAVETLRAMVQRRRVPGTVRHSASRLVAAAGEVRDNLPGDLWRVLANLDETLAAVSPDDARVASQLATVLESTLALSGVFGESLVRDDAWGYISSGVRLERARGTLTLLSETLVVQHSPAVETRLAEAVLAVGESSITHRRRSVSGAGSPRPEISAVDLLLLDPRNPRSVAFQMARLVEAFSAVGDAELSSAANALVSQLNEVPPSERLGEELRSVVAHAQSQVRAITGELSDRHFRRQSPARRMPTDWKPPSSQDRSPVGSR